MGLRVLLLCAGLLASAFTAAGDPVAGEHKAATCGACHGADGLAITPLWPNLAGQNAAYLAKQLRSFRDGSRKDPLMQPLAKSLSDEDIADIAAWYSAMDGTPLEVPDRH